MKTQNDLSLFSACETIVCDLDGTLYLENEPLPGAHDFLGRIIESGRQLFYFTNNTSKSRETYLKKLSAMDFPAVDHNLITAADCAENYLKRTGLFPYIYLIGNSDLKSDFERRDFIPLSEDDALNKIRPAAVVLGFDTELTYKKIHTCYELILAGIPFVATHADILCPLTKGRFMPDVGSFISLFETATRGQRPHVVGKPEKEAVEAICARANQPPEKIAFVGDRLYTDMRMAERYNMVGVLVLSGETDPEMALIVTISWCSAEGSVGRMTMVPGFFLDQR